MGLEHLSDKNTYSELQEDQTKQVAEEVTQTVRAMYQEGHIDKPTAEYLLPPPMVSGSFVCLFDIFPFSKFSEAYSLALS